MKTIISALAVMAVIGIAGAATPASAADATWVKPVDPCAKPVGHAHPLKHHFWKWRCATGFVSEGGGGPGWAAPPEEPEKK
jgi:ABC-type sugar transport system substrate-binding protein